jgi:hypothetical protein
MNEYIVHVPTPEMKEILAKKLTFAEYIWIDGSSIYQDDLYDFIYIDIDRKKISKSWYGPKPDDKSITIDFTDINTIINADISINVNGKLYLESEILEALNIKNKWKRNKKFSQKKSWHST